jgi:streptogramin lyase
VILPSVVIELAVLALKRPAASAAEAFTVAPAKTIGARVSYAMALESFLGQDA